MLSLTLLVVLCVGTPAVAHPGGDRELVQTLRDLGNHQVDRLLARATADSRIEVAAKNSQQAEVRVVVDGKVRDRVLVRLDELERRTAPGNDNNGNSGNNGNNGNNGNSGNNGNNGNSGNGNNGNPGRGRDNAADNANRGRNNGNGNNGNGNGNNGNGNNGNGNGNNGNGNGNNGNGNSGRPPAPPVRPSPSPRPSPPATPTPTPPAPAPAPRPTEAPAGRAGADGVTPLPDTDLAPTPDRTPVAAPSPSPTRSPAPASPTPSAPADEVDPAAGDEADTADDRDEDVALTAGATPPDPGSAANLGERLSRAGETGGAMLREARRAFETLPAPVRTFGMPFGLALALAGYLALQRRFRPGLLPMSVSGEPGQEGVRDRHRL